VLPKPEVRFSRRTSASAAAIALRAARQSRYSGEDLSLGPPNPPKLMLRGCKGLAKITADIVFDVSALCASHAASVSSVGGSHIRIDTF